MIEEKKMVIKKENGELSCFSLGNDEIKCLRRMYSNPCAKCEKAYADKCPKIACDDSKNISDFDFIDGYQIVNKHRELDEIIISMCANYEVDHERVKPTTFEELERIRRLKESIKILYFGAIDPEEADRVQSDLFRRGQLIDYDSISDKDKVLKK